MRNAILVALAVTLLITLGAVGQQDLLIDLRIEPERSESAITLYQAAAGNDYPRFVALYGETPVAEYEELHRLWTWAMEDPIGAFYGTERYERLRRLYPRYAAWIAQYRIVDAHGNSFYPTAETRRFLLSEAILGVTPARREAPLRIAQTAAPAAVAPAAPTPETRPASPATPAVTRAVTPPLQTAARPVAVAPRLVAPLPAVAAAPLPAVAAAPLPVMAAADPEPVRGLVRRNEADRGALSRGIFLMIAGLIGIGMLTVMLHAPADENRNFTRHAP